MNQFADKQRRTLITSIFIFLLLALSIVAIGANYYRNFERQSRADAESQLSASATSKVNGLIDWRGNLLDRANFIYKNQAFTDSAALYMKDRRDTEAREHIRNWLEAYSEYDEFDRIYLLDTNGAEIFSVPEGTPPAQDVTQKIPEALKSKQITFIDFYRDAEDKRVYLAILIPILDENQSRRVIGFAALRVNPQARLYSYLARKSAEYADAEFFIVRREGDAAVFLNPLKFRPDAPLNLSAPLSEKKNIAAMAMLGRTGIIEGMNYRGVATIAFAQSVPDSPWVLAAYMVASDVYAPARKNFGGTIVVTGTIIFYSGLGVLLIWRQRQLKHYQFEAQAAEILRKTEDELRLLTHELDDKVRTRTEELFKEKQRAELLVEDIRENREQLRALSQQMVGMQEAQIKNLAHELHDRVGQNLTAININMSLLQQLMPENYPENIKARLADTTQIVEETVARMRNVIADFLPPMLENYGLAPALSWYGEQFTARTQIPVRVSDGRAGATRLSPQAEIGLFRIVQEALNNVAKYAHAAQASIDLQDDGGDLVMTISDNGAGFDPQVVFAKPEHWGFAIMRERAKALDASFDVQSAPGKGVTIVLRIKR